MPRMFRLLVLSLFVVVAVGRPVPTRACSCVGDEGRFLVADGGEIPANARGVVWWGPFFDKDHKLRLPTTAEFRVERWRGGLFHPVDFKVNALTPPGPAGRYPDPMVLLEPLPGMAAGEVYRFSRLPGESVGEPGEPTASVEVTVGDTPFDPQVPVKLRVEALGRDIVDTTTTSGSCWTHLDADRARIELVWPGPAEKWRDSLFYITGVDDKAWRPSRSLCERVPPGSSWQGRGQELVFATCTLVGTEARPLDSLKEGTHRVEMRIWLPGTEIVAVAATTVSLRCG